MLSLKDLSRHRKRTTQFVERINSNPTWTKIRGALKKEIPYSGFADDVNKRVRKIKDKIKK